MVIPMKYETRFIIIANSEIIRLITPIIMKIVL